MNNELQPIDLELTHGYILVVASSSRMLAQSARASGFKPLVIDLFADLDTQRYAEDFKQIISLAEQHLKLAVDYFIENYQVDQLVYGSGFEHHPDSLSYLDSRLTLLGNEPEVFMGLHNKEAFFTEFKRLNIPFPSVQFTKPDLFEGWLLKPMQGQGGVGIRHYLGEQVDSECYWQRYQAGQQYSVLFLADGLQFQLVGFNSQWSTQVNKSSQFLFSGIINACDLKAVQQAEILDCLEKLVPLFKLKGLNSLDFINDGNSSFLLEINPRPSASMQLYDADLFKRHIKACQGGLSDAHYPIKGVTGCQIVYAQSDIIIPEGFVWHENCSDFPETGVICRTGQPICSIMSHKNQVHSVMIDLQTQQLNLQKRFLAHGI